MKVPRTVIACLLLLATAFAEAAEPSQFLFTNVSIFDGKSEKLITARDVLVENNLIKEIGKNIQAADGAKVIDGGGRTLLPGFIETHAHLMLMGPSLPAMEAMTTWEDFAIHGTRMAEMYLMQGFTTVRDAGGANGGLRRAIDAGEIVGPRYYPSGAFLSSRGGHADFGNFTSPPGESTNFSRLNMAQEFNGVDDIYKYGRNNFRMGATQLKFMQSGGVVSAFDPWQLVAGSPEEIAAAVQVANEYGSYVMAHSYRKEAIMNALNAGVKSIEHGFAFDCEIAKVMKKKGAYITTNLTAFDPGLLDIPAVASVPASLRQGEIGIGDVCGLHRQHEEVPRQARLPDRLRRVGGCLQHPDRLREAPEQRVLRAVPVAGDADVDGRRDRRNERRFHQPVSRGQAGRDRGRRLCRHPDRRRQSAGRLLCGWHRRQVV